MAGESIRVWPSAVIVDETVRLGDVAALRGFGADAERTMAALKITAAPSPGGSRVIDLAMIRDAIAAHGSNMAAVTIGGAMRCAVTRPASNPSVPSAGTHPTSHTRGQVGQDETKPGSKPSTTLRQAVQDFFDSQLARYAGRAEISFNETSRQVLDLAGPDYTFTVRRRNGPVLGLIQIEVAVRADGRTVQTVPLVVQVSMTRQAVLARRAINRGATIRATDVEIVPVAFSRLEKLGLDDAARVIGQRAKNFVPPGTVLQADVLQSIPLVNRGQLVTLTSVAGAVQVVTTAKALQDGVLGDSITVRSTENRRVEFDATIVGPGAVRVGDMPIHRTSVAMAAGGGQ